MAAIRVVTRDEICVPKKEAKRGDISKMTLINAKFQPSHI